MYKCALIFINLKDLYQQIDKTSLSENEHIEENVKIIQKRYVNTFKGAPVFC